MTELEERWRDVGAFIREQRSLGELSLRRLSELAGVSNPYLSQIERGLRKPSAEILRQIASALQISAETLYVRAGILDEHDDQVDVVTAIRRDPAIEDHQKRALLNIYESFRQEAARRAGADIDVSSGEAGADADVGDATSDEADAPDDDGEDTVMAPTVPTLDADLLAAAPKPSDDDAVPTASPAVVE